MMADMMRHFYARQHLGKAIVICDDPEDLVAAARKQWLRLSRTLQHRRELAANAVEILKYTYTITQMQQTHFADALPHERPGANAYFVTPEQAQVAAEDCLTLYMAAVLPAPLLRELRTKLLGSGLMVDYCGQLEAHGASGLRSKIELERMVASGWDEVDSFLAGRGIDTKLFGNRATQTEILDDAVDAVLDVDSEFMAIATSFQRKLDLARPLKIIAKAEREKYETFLMLALRVQTLTPSGFSARFLSTYADDTFLLNDILRLHESLAEAVARHQAAGRANLARALMRSQSGMVRGLAAHQLMPV
jgi:hypothetical protein